MICVYLFDPIFNEANESSSACEPGIELHVETNTPPVGEYHTGKAENIKAVRGGRSQRDGTVSRTSSAWRNGARSASAVGRRLGGPLQNCARRSYRKNLIT